MTRNDATAAAGERAPGPRQAIVLIHGIGEQRPMDTLRAFVAAFLERDTYYSKPDTLSDSYELRRFKLRRAPAGPGAPAPTNMDWPETDFYEYYWAHQMYGTQVSHVVSWFLRILRLSPPFLRFGTTDYPRLRTLTRLAWLLVLAVVAAMAMYLWTYGGRVAEIGQIAGLGIGTAAAAALWFLARQTALRVLVDVSGDAARYFDVNPKNVPRRYDILRGGVDMLRKLHEDRDEADGHVKYRYGRIVLVGHSLGSVIAYDILQHYWQDVNGEIDVSDIDFSDVENYAGSNGAPEFPGAKPYDDVKRFHEFQRTAWRHFNASVPSDVALPLSRARSRWLVSDLVTLGSPLAHAPLLMADGLENLAEKKRLREFSICPPDRSHHLNKGRFTVPLSMEADRLVCHPILQQGGYFALTRWTNFYFSADPVGGPLKTPFGDGIEDVHLENGPASPIRAHVGYWRAGKDHPSTQRLDAILKGTAP
jgi:hypothetical protein